MKVPLLLLLGALPLLAAAQTQVPVSFSGGHETDPRDHGRPVVLVAAALNVPAGVFREAFTHVHPAGPGSGGPTPDEARANKKALIQALGPYGVTNDRLDEVSTYYRYQRQEGKLWRNVPASAYAIVSNGAITGFVITNPGAGYSSPPAVTVPGMNNVKATVVLAFGTDLKTNGSIQSVKLEPSP